MRHSLRSVPDPVAVVEADSSEPDTLDLAASERDAAALRRDSAAEHRDQVAEGLAPLEGVSDVEAARVTSDRMLAARDRAAAALDRREAALDRGRAQRYLEASYRDDLTGALQRSPGRDQLLSAVARAHRAKEPLVVAFLDVDHLKRVNDEHGHAAGDDLLRAVALALRSALRPYDIVVRYGGDEFVCGLPDSRVTDVTARFVQVLDDLAAAVDGASFSVGLAQLHPDEELDDVIARADRVMYESRRARA
ncbi:MAG: diguanylate cyclase [Frankiaceae bacterium]|nr:diguanylate cyclase [Frankiaceae bacterium]